MVIEKHALRWQIIGSEPLDQLSTKIHPNIKYKIDRPDLHGSGIDLPKTIGKLPTPKKGWTFPDHNYTGPYNPLEQQLKSDLDTGEILEIYQQQTGATDRIAVQHDVDHSVCADKKNNKKMQTCG